MDILSLNEETTKEEQSWHIDRDKVNSFSCGAFFFKGSVEEEKANDSDQVGASFFERKRKFLHTNETLQEIIMFLSSSESNG